MQHSIHLTLRALIETKSRRDNVKFTACQLAQILGIPRSIITKLTHADVNKRVTNPKLETLMKIVSFFKSDGFDVTLDSLLGITSQQLQSTTIQVYSMNNIQHCIGTATLNVCASSSDMFGIQSSIDIPPCFKGGSVFVVTPTENIQVNNLVAIKNFTSNAVQIKKYHTDQQRIFLKSLDIQEPDIHLQPPVQYLILGIVSQINAKT